MRRLIGTLAVLGILGLWLGLAAPAGALCLPDAVPSGNLCMDKYEASVWQTTNASLILKIKLGVVTNAALTAAGATQFTDMSTGSALAACPANGNGCTTVYAVSIPGVTPTANITWFQAAAAARNAGKRLPTNAEWQAAALGTPDPGVSPGPADCNTNSSGPDLTGARSHCKSDVGAFDMVRNPWEWVADWVPLSTVCPVGAAASAMT